MSITLLIGLGVLAGGLAATLFWIVALTILRLPTSSLHGTIVYATVASFICVNLTVVVAFTNGGNAVTAIFGLGMGLQLVAAISALLFARSRS